MLPTLPTLPTQRPIQISTPFLVFLQRCQQFFTLTQCRQIFYFIRQQGTILFNLFAGIELLTRISHGQLDALFEFKKNWLT